MKTNVARYGIFGLALALIVSLVPSVATASSCSGGSSPDIVATAAQNGSFTTLLSAAKAAGLVDALQGDGPLTVFAPTDEAFAKLPAGTVESLLKPENRDRLAAILTYHVVAGSIPAEHVVKASFIETLNGQRPAVSVKDGVVKVGSATVTATDIRTSNGIIHVIDEVLIPSDKDLVSTAVAAGSFSTLAAAIGAAGLVEALQGEGPFTVFAPTDEAFAKLPEHVVASLLKPENKHDLIAVLTYHVVSGSIYSSDVSPGEVETLQGSKLTVSNKDGLRIDQAGLVATDIAATNGVIHVIDEVILPEALRASIANAGRKIAMNR